MSKIEKVTREDLEKSIDHTWLTDSLMSKKWKCPHCGRENKTSIYADECLLENFKYLEHCWCGYVHCWELKLTEEFKKNVIEYLMKGDINDRKHGKVKK